MREFICRLYLSQDAARRPQFRFYRRVRHYTLKVLTSYDPEYAIGLFGSGQYQQVVDYCRLFADQGIAVAQCQMGGVTSTSLFSKSDFEE